MDIGIQHFKMFHIPVSTRALKGVKSLKMPSDSTSESVIFQNFLGECPQTPQYWHALYAHVFVHYDSAYPSYPHINSDDTSGCVPPFSKVWMRPWESWNKICALELNEQVNNYGFRPKLRSLYLLSLNNTFCLHCMGSVGAALTSKCSKCI